MEVMCLYAGLEVLAATTPLPLRLSFWLLLVVPLLAAWGMRVVSLLRWPAYLNLVPLVVLSGIGLILWLRLAIAPHLELSAHALIALVSAPEGLDPPLDRRLVVGVLALGIVLWGRGLYIASNLPNSDVLNGLFVVGTLLFLGIFAVMIGWHEPRLQALSGELQRLLVSFYVVGLTLMALVHSQNLHRRIGQRQPVSLGWFLALLLPMGGIGALAALMTGALGPLLRGIVQAALWVVALVWYGLRWAGYLLLLLLAWLASLLPSCTPSPPMPIRQPPPLFDPLLLELEELPQGEGAIVVPGIVIVLMLAAIAGLFVWLLLRRLRIEPGEAVEEDRASVWSWTLFWGQIRAAWVGLLGRLRRGQAGAPAKEVGDGAAEDGSALSEIRLIYRALLRWAGSLNVVRRREETPRELAVRLTARLPEGAEPVRTVTAIYERARYGSATIEDRALEQAREALREVTRPRPAPGEADQARPPSQPISGSGPARSAPR